MHRSSTLLHFILLLSRMLFTYRWYQRTAKCHYSFIYLLVTSPPPLLSQWYYCRTVVLFVLASSCRELSPIPRIAQRASVRAYGVGYGFIHPRGKRWDIHPRGKGWDNPSIRLWRSSRAAVRVDGKTSALITCWSFAQRRRGPRLQSEGEILAIHYSIRPRIQKQTKNHNTCILAR